MQTKLVFQRPVARVGNLAISIVFGALGTVVVSGVLGGRIDQRVLAAIGVAAIIWWLLPKAWRQLKHPAPTLMLDDEGVEGSFGFVPWDAVIGVRVTRRYKGIPQLIRQVELSLRPGAARRTRTPRAEYASRDVTGSAVVRDDTLWLPMWGSRRRVLDDLRPYVEHLDDYGAAACRASSS